MKYWLVKSEPEVYSIDQLEHDQTTWWEGIRNYQARNFLRDDMKVGDLVLFYHSNAEPPGVAGIARVSKPAAPDQTQFNKKSEYFDPKAKVDAPPWVCPELEFVRKFPELISLEQIRKDPSLAGMLLLQKGQRLSVQPVTPEHFAHIEALGTGSKASTEMPEAAKSSAAKSSAAKSSAAKPPVAKTPLSKPPVTKATPSKSVSAKSPTAKSTTRKSVSAKPAPVAKNSKAAVKTMSARGTL